MNFFGDFLFKISLDVYLDLDKAWPENEKLTAEMDSSYMKTHKRRLIFIMW